MDNRHIITPNASNSPTHSINDLEEHLGLLNVNANMPSALGTVNPTNLPLNTNINENVYSNLNSRANPSIGNSNHRLNPSAQVFVPRSMMSSPNATSYSTPHLPVNNSQPPANNHNISNGSVNNNQSAGFLEGENDIEDYIALSYLKEFISSISNKPSIYDLGISEITSIVNSYLDEDECVLELIVNQIVDQSIVDVNFRYNGVRLCFHFMENLRPTNSGQTFKIFLFKRCQRECSRKVFPSTSANTFNHLRGLALFAADLFSRCKAPQLAESLPNLLANIISPTARDNENVKCVCQVLKLCGQQLDGYFIEQNKDDVKNVLKKLGEVTESNVSSHIIDMVKNIIKLAENGWMEQAKAPTTSNIKNPYQNISDNMISNAGYFDTYNSNYPIADMYDFGGDEFDEEVCNDFENFLKNLPPDNS